MAICTASVASAATNSGRAAPVANVAACVERPATRPVAFLTLHRLGLADQHRLVEHRRLQHGAVDRHHLAGLDEQHLTRLTSSTATVSNAPSTNRWATFGASDNNSDNDHAVRRWAYCSSASPDATINAKMTPASRSPRSSAPPIDTTTPITYASATNGNSPRRQATTTALAPPASPVGLAPVEPMVTSGTVRLECRSRVGGIRGVNRKPSASFGNGLDVEPDPSDNVVEPTNASATPAPLTGDAVTELVAPRKHLAQHRRRTLVLINCGGDYNPEIRRFRENIVVYAVPIG